MLNFQFGQSMPRRLSRFKVGALILGIKLLLLSIAIFLFPELLAYIVASVLLVFAVLFLGIWLVLGRLSNRGPSGQDASFYQYNSWQ